MRGVCANHAARPLPGRCQDAPSLPGAPRHCSTEWRACFFLCLRVWRFVGCTDGDELRPPRATSPYFTQAEIQQKKRCAAKRRVVHASFPS